MAGEGGCSATSGVFELSSDCTVSSHIVVTGTLNITGIPDANGVLPKIIGGGSNRLFKVEGGGELYIGYVNMTRGDLTDGSLTGLDRYGAAVFADGTSGGAKFDARHVVISSNRAVYGGAVYGHQGAIVILFNCKIRHNEATEGGGCCFADKGNSQLTISGGTVIEHNSANSGGAIYCYQAICTVEDGTIIRFNSASSSGSQQGGGAIFTYRGNTVTLRDSYIYENNAVAGRGDIIYTLKNNAELPNIYISNVVFGVDETNGFGGDGCAGTSNYCNTNICNQHPTYCDYLPNSTCIDRANNLGVM